MMDTMMTRSEKVKLATTDYNPNSSWVMNCTVPKLVETCFGFLTLIDDAQQQAGDDGDLEKAQELSQLYDDVEAIYHRLIAGCGISRHHRNQLRLTFKHVLQITSA
jgi:hypothetical protein